MNQLYNQVSGHIVGYIGFITNNMANYLNVVYFGLNSVKVHSPNKSNNLKHKAAGIIDTTQRRGLTLVAKIGIFLPPWTWMAMVKASWNMLISVSATPGLWSHSHWSKFPQQIQQSTTQACWDSTILRCKLVLMGCTWATPNCASSLQLDGMFICCEYIFSCTLSFS